MLKKSLLLTLLLILTNTSPVKAKIDHRLQLSSNFLSSNFVGENPIKIQKNIGPRIYGITKKVGRDLKINAEIDDGIERTFRKYGLFFAIFGVIFFGVAIHSLFFKE